MDELQFDADLQERLAGLRGLAGDVASDAVAICTIPAPTFAEANRAAYVLDRMRALGLGSPRLDDAGDVITELPGEEALPAVVLMAHLDTVFGPDVPIAVRQEGTVLHGPGIGDNSVGVAGLLALGRALAGLPNRGTVVLAANVGEEGLGNLRGARALWDQYGTRAGAWVVVEGATFNRGVAAGVGSRRLSVTYRGRGGHSWLDFGRPSAVHALGRLVSRLAAIDVPREPKTTFNVGLIRGGTSVNTIAAEASLLLDMRSLDPQALARLDGVAGELITATARASGVDAAVEVVGDRAGGSLPARHPMLRLVDAVAASLGTEVRWEAGSTDANVPLSHGAPAVCLGLAHGEGAHTVTEWLDTSDLPLGLSQAYVVAGHLLRGDGR